MSDLVPIRRALISVSDKTGLIPLGQILAAKGIEILSTGGSAAALRAAGIPVKEVSDHTGFPEILDGRVKTLVPQIHGGILGRRDLPEHAAQMAQHGIAPIDLVVVNLYPFEQTVAAGRDREACIESIDIGGPALIRAAAKNHDAVAVITEPAQYVALQEESKPKAAPPWALRRHLAGAAYAFTAAYDSAIAAWFAGQASHVFPAPHQRHRDFCARPCATAKTRTSKPPSTAAAPDPASPPPGRSRARNSPSTISATPTPHFECVAEFADPTIVIVKHANPCGVATAATLAQAWDEALACDPVSAFGGIVAANRPLDAAAAERITAIFSEVIVAPDADDEAPKPSFPARRTCACC